MAKKDKKSKKQQKADDDWENEIGETIPPAGGAAEESTPPVASSPPAAAPADDDNFAGGGLLGAIKKNRDKKKKGKKQQDTSWEDELGESAPGAGAAEDADAASPPPKPTEVTEIDEDDFGPAKKGKKGGNKAPAAATPPAEKEEEGGEVRVKTKKEKEKEKKEREKQRKKEQAARKKGAEPAKVAAPEKKDEAPKPAAAPAAESKTGAAGKGKKVPAAIAALRRQQELLRQQQEEAERAAEEERKRIEEEERAREEEERKRDEAKARKKEKEKEKKEQLKKEGKYLTKKQKEEQARARLRLEQMKAAGMVVPNVDGQPPAPRKPMVDKKKKGQDKKSDKKAEEEAAKKAAEEKKRKEEAERLEKEKKAKEEEERKKKEEEEAAKAQETDEDVLDSWEKALEEEEVKDSWDASSDEEEEEDKPAAAASKATPAPAKPTAAANGKKVEESEEESSEEESESEDEDLSSRKRMEAQRKAEAAARREKQLADAKAAASKDNLRSPICCILGHVDTGKTKLLDKIRQTNVQEGEAGGITQQIGATYFPSEAIRTKTRVVDPKNEMEFKAPGLLIIDTPGHESFTNLRSRGSSLCNIAILVVDIMHGLEPQTIESIRLLRDRKTPFIVALNKIDRLFDWNPTPNGGFRESLNKQKKSVQNEFKDRLKRTMLEFSEQGLNSQLFDENRNMSKFVSLVPTSAHTGEGIPDMLKLLVELTQNRMAGQLMFLSSLECTVLEVKVVEGLGTTIDVILSNGILHEGDRIVLCGLNGAIATNVRALLTPQPLKELRVKSQYVHNKEIKAAMGIKIAANDLESAIAGSRLLVVGPDDDEEDLMDEVMGDLEDLLGKVSTTGKGVAVQASTLGSLEALLEFLRTSNIPVSSISIGPVFKRDVMRAGAMLEKNKEFAVMLCFDVKVDKEAQAYADEVGVKIFTADIIYHLFDNFTAYQKEMLEAQRREAAANAVWPCVLHVVAVFMKKDPIVVGVDVLEGVLKIGAPIAAVKPNGATGEMETIVLGRVTSIQLNHKAVPLAKKGSPSVAVKIEGPNQPLYGRQLDQKDQLYSHISRTTIETLKKYYRDEVAKEDWHLIVKLKKVFNIP